MRFESFADEQMHQIKSSPGFHHFGELGYCFDNPLFPVPV